MRCLLAVVLTLAVVAPARAATPFADVPRTHWAYAAIQGVHDEGMFPDHDGRFEGQGHLSRYQIAVVVAKLLDCATHGTARPVAPPLKINIPIDPVVTDFADQLAVLIARVAILEKDLLDLRRTLDALKNATARAKPATGSVTPTTRCPRRPIR